MIDSLTLESASNYLLWSNRLYILGATLTVVSAALVLYDKTVTKYGSPTKFGRSAEIAVVVTAFVSLGGNISAITFGNLASHLKDVAYDTFRLTAETKISELQNQTADALREAARLKGRQGDVELRQGTLEQRQSDLQNGIATLSEDERSTVARLKRAEGRGFKLTPSEIASLERFAGSKLLVSGDALVPDDAKLQGAVMSQLRPSIQVYSRIVMGPAAGTAVTVPGIHLVYPSNSETMKALADLIEKGFQRTGTTVDRNKVKSLDNLPSPGDFFVIEIGPTD